MLPMSVSNLMASSQHNKLLLLAETSYNVGYFAAGNSANTREQPEDNAEDTPYDEGSKGIYQP